MTAPATAVPLIDVAPFRLGTGEDKRRVAAAVAQACEQIGFLTITGHGVPEPLIAAASAAAWAFFDLPADEKARLALSANGAGYSPVRGESLAATRGDKAPADLKESLNIGPDFDALPWPVRPAELRPALTAYYRRLNSLAGELMRIFATALELREDYFADKIERSRSFLRLINYPPPLTEPEPGQLRAGAHTDYGTLTILRAQGAENLGGGLQVRSRNGEWLDVAAPPGAFVVNIGDMLMRWTNDRWVSTLHRVANPPAEAGVGSRRQSQVFFHNPNPDAVVACLPGCQDLANPARYAPITAGEFIAEKSRRAYGTGG